MLMILVYFPSGGCVDDVVSNWTNYHFGLSCPFLKIKKGALIFEKRSWLYPSSILSSSKSIQEKKVPKFFSAGPSFLVFLTKCLSKCSISQNLLFLEKGFGCAPDHSRTIMNSARMCWIIRRTVFNVYVCLNHSWRYEHNQLERCDEKPRR